MDWLEAMQQRWDDYRPTKAMAIGLAIAAVVVTLVLGFGVGGWMSRTTGEQMVAAAASEARNNLAAAVCAERFMRGDHASARLAKLNGSGWYDRNQLVEQGGWATMPDRKEPDSAVASMCASLLAEKKA